MAMQAGTVMDNQPSDIFDPSTIDRQLICEGWGEHLTFPSSKRRDIKRHLRRKLYEKSLIDFGQAAWPIIEPGREFIPGKHIEAMCEHLQAVTRGDIKRLVLNVPPGTGKSLWVSALWPTWSWTNDPYSQWLFASFSTNNTIRDSRKRREIIKSQWYRNFWWGWRIKEDQDTAHRFENSKQGFMQATSTGSGSTGTHASFLIYDDPHDRMDRYSKVKREEAVNWYKTVFTSLNLGPDTRYVIVAQRITEDDMTGYVLANELGYDHLCIPLAYDSRHPHANKATSLGWRDWRTKDGEVMWPVMFPPETIAGLKKEKSSYDLAAQYQQNPTRDEGAMFPRSSFLYFKSDGYGDDEVLTLYQRDGTERRVLAAQCQWFQCADTALETSESSAWTVVGTFLITPQPAAMLVYDIARERLSVPKQYGFLVTQKARFPRVGSQYVEKKASGHGLLQEGAMRGNVFGALKAEGSKDMRLVPASIQYENGVVFHRMAHQAPWLETFENEIAGLPDSEWRDQGDVLGYAGIMFQRYWITEAYSQQSIAYVHRKADGGELGVEADMAGPARPMTLAERLTGRRFGGRGDE